MHDAGFDGASAAAARRTRKPAHSTEELPTVSERRSGSRLGVAHEARFVPGRPRAARDSRLPLPQLRGERKFTVGTVTAPGASPRALHPSLDPSIDEPGGEPAA